MSAGCVAGPCAVVISSANRLLCPLYKNFSSPGRPRMRLWPRMNHPVPTQNSELSERLADFPRDRRTVARHDHHSICSRFHALVPVSQPSVARIRARRLATSADRLATATPSPPPASFRRPPPMGVPLCGRGSSTPRNPAYPDISSLPDRRTRSPQMPSYVAPFSRKRSPACFAQLL
jgi:hypothetical protein